MSSYLFSVMAQSGAGSDWNWFLIFIIFVVILAIALVVQARFSKEDAAELTHHEEDDQHEEAELVPEASPDPETEPESEAESAPEPEADSEPEGAEAPPETVAEPNDLKILEGIGPKVASILNENGITTFPQLAETSVEKLDEILDANKLHMMHPGSWPQQAKLAADGDWDALEKLQDDFKGRTLKKYPSVKIKDRYSNVSVFFFESR